MTIIPETNKCQFNCVGEIRCIKGYESRRGDTLMCLADATWNAAVDECQPMIQNTSTVVQATREFAIDSTKVC